MNGRIKKIIEPLKKIKSKKPSDVFKSAIEDFGGKLHCFGSSVTGLHLKESDLDLCVEYRGRLSVLDLQRIAKRLRMMDILAIPTARTPILKFYDPNIKSNCDVNINGLLGVQNSKLISDYLSIDERAFDLALYIKYWSHENNLNGFQNYLSSYCFTLMVIHFLQLKEILPDLQDLDYFGEMFPNIKIQNVECQDYDCTYFNKVNLIEKNENIQDDLDQLVYRFFHYYATYDYNIPITINQYGVDDSIPQNPMILIDPFDYFHNVAKGISKEKLETLIDIFYQNYKYSKRLYKKV